MRQRQRTVRTALSLALGLLAAAFVLVPFFAPASGVRVAVRVGIELALVVAVWSLSERRGFRWLVLGLVLLKEASEHAMPGAPSPAWVMADLLLDVALVASIGGFLALTAWRAREVGAETLTGAVAVYLLLGHFWATTYSLMEFVEPGSFRNLCVEADDCDRALGRYSRALYFSYVTLTTLGYGDVLPVTRRAEGLATLASLSGQLYIAVLIGRLVGDYLARRRRAGDEDGPGG